MNLFKSRNAGQEVPIAGPILQPLPWHPWAALLAVLVLLLATHFLFKPTLELSDPLLSIHGSTCTVSFQAFNHGKQPLSATLLVTAANFKQGTGKPLVTYYREVAHTSMPILLTIQEKKNFACNLPLENMAELPNQAKVTVSSLR